MPMAENDKNGLESELIERAQAGDTAAFDELSGRYMDRVYAFALRLSADADIAADATQDTFIKAWKSIRRFDTTRGFQPWVFAIARNAALDIMRKRREPSFSSLQTGGEGEDGRDFDEDIAADEPVLGAEFDRAIDEQILRRALDLLNPDQRAAVLLHDMEGMTFEEISRITGKPLNTEKSHYRRALIKLRSIIDRRL